ncbi:hypothetical protein [Frateuria sp.]|uniref:hypothetical protein n=1 Tax=Frateuria sp. TaxID=2211372 RepID=UPI003F8206C0
MSRSFRLCDFSPWLMAIACAVCIGIYLPGLSGAFLFDDYPNIVDNNNLHITDAHLSSLVRAALSSPASEFKRPLASLSFAANYLATGLAPLGWKLINLAIHLANGLLVYLLAAALIRALPGAGPGRADRTRMVAALIAMGWMVLPINLTAVLYIVQRMESLANLFVLAGLIGYVKGRQRMMAGQRGIWLCIASLLVATAIGLLAKETAVMLPLYAFLIEWIVFRFGSANGVHNGGKKHRGLQALFALVLALPLLVGLAWLAPGLLRASTWATRDFTLGTRLLSEARIVADYVAWTLLPNPEALSFYHDDFRVSTGLLAPWSTLASIAFLAGLVATIWFQRKRRPLVALGLALYLGCHLLTGTILPLELIYEHRNYFASFGLLLAVVPWLAAPAQQTSTEAPSTLPASIHHPLPMSLPRYVALGGLMLFWAAQTAMTAYAWGNPLRLAQDLAGRAPDSPRAQYELGRAYIIYSHYDPDSVFTRMAYAPLERAMKLPDSSILSEQALIFFNARIHRPIADAWWDSLIGKLKARKPGVQDESSLAALTQCQREGLCDLSKQRMLEAFLAALSHPKPSARLLANYGDYAWNVLGDRELGIRMAKAASAADPAVPVYHVTLARQALVLGRLDEVRQQIDVLRHLNVGGSLDPVIAELTARLPAYH